MFIMTKKELVDRLAEVPDDYDVRSSVPIRLFHDGMTVDRNIWKITVSMQRGLVVLETEAIDMGPR